MKPSDFAKRITEVSSTASPDLAPEETALLAAFEPAMQTIESETPAAAALLNLCAFLAPDEIPLDLFRQGGDDNPEALRPVAGDPEELNETVSVLLRSSLAKRDGDLLFVHRLIQKVARERLGEEDKGQMAGTAAILVSSAMPMFEHGAFDAATAAEYDRVDAHALVAAAHAVAAEAELATASRLLNQVGFYRYLRADYAAAERLYKRSLEVAERALGPEHTEVSIRLNNLAVLYQDLNRLEDAEPLIRRALEIDENTYGPDHPDVALRLNNLAMLLQATGRMDEAEKLIRRALEIDEEALGPDHPNVAVRLNNLAFLLMDTERLEEAEPLIRRALSIDEAALGPHHPNVALRLSNLSHLLQGTDRTEEAEPLIRRALSIDEAALGPEHPNVAIWLNNLAMLLLETERAEEAEPHIRRALEIDEKALGAEHPNVALRLENLAQLLEQTDRAEEAAPLRRRAERIREGP